MKAESQESGIRIRFVEKWQLDPERTDALRMCSCGFIYSAKGPSALADIQQAFEAHRAECPDNFGRID